VACRFKLLLVVDACAGVKNEGTNVSALRFNVLVVFLDFAVDAFPLYVFLDIITTYILINISC
jgi:hypothetical protein